MVENALVPALDEFHKWAIEHNEELYTKGQDVLGCVKLWEDYLMTKKHEK